MKKGQIKADVFALVSANPDLTCRELVALSSHSFTKSQMSNALSYMCALGELERDTSKKGYPRYAQPKPAETEVVLAPAQIPSRPRVCALRSFAGINAATGKAVDTIVPLAPDTVRQLRQAWKCSVSDGWHMLKRIAEQELGWSAQAIAVAFGYRPDTPRTTWATHGPLYVTMALADTLGLVMVFDPQGGVFFVSREDIDSATRVFA